MFYYLVETTKEGSPIPAKTCYLYEMSTNLYAFTLRPQLIHCCCCCCYCCCEAPTAAIEPVIVITGCTDLKLKTTPARAGVEHPVTTCPRHLFDRICATKRIRQRSPKFDKIVRKKFKSEIFTKFFDTKYVN